MIRFYDIELFSFSFSYLLDDYVLIIEFKSKDKFYKIRCLLSDKDCVSLKQLFYIIKSDMILSIDLIVQDDYLKFLTSDNVDCIKIDDFKLEV